MPTSTMIEPNRPWHPFRQPGMCGLRGTTIILTLIGIIITGIILSQEVKLERNETLSIRPKREKDDSFPDKDRLKVMSEIKERIKELSTSPTHRYSNRQGEAAQDIDFFMGSNLDQDTKKVRVAKAKCDGNYACALALLQRGILADEVRGDCWVCLQLHSMWRTQELTADMILNDNGNCEMPKQMSLIVQMSLNFREGRPPTAIMRGYNCSYTGKPFQGPAFYVYAHPAELCVCSKSGRHIVGMSDCRNVITLSQSNSGRYNCTIQYPNKTIEGFECPFSHLDSAPGMVWVCGETAYYHLDAGEWKGCCYAAILSTGTSMMEKKNLATSLNRQKRETKLPDYYAGHKISDPWTTPWENVGWSIAGLFTGTGTTVALNKINGLAWQVLSLENDTAQALNLISIELKKMRVAVVQHRLALDILTAEKGGVCKMLGVSCCFSIPDYAENVTDVVKHMRESVREPTPVDATWFQWLDNLSGGWGYWITGTVIPVVMTVLALLILLPCILQCVVGCVKRSVTSFTTKGTYQMMLAKRTTDVNQAMLVGLTPKGFRPKDQNQIWGSTFDRNSDTDEDDNDYVLTQELEPEPIPVIEGPRNVDERDNEVERDNEFDDSVIEIGTVEDEE
ncbi:Env protein HERV-H/p62 [Triplophysa tibetana]|uniref:Env protein HERV-H/p62 n=1 Tax=Triplophysa tibetana TaxID=1572043 RepID=A0A5A9NWG1_9TELE|nr:Env protein HERV-H/p62 [Triplophysa tibetana]